MREMGIKPELEIYNLAMMQDVYNLVDKEILAKPYWMSFVMGMHRVNRNAIPYTPENLIVQIRALPPDSMFSVIAIGPDELPATTTSILLGGHCRVGFEDNVYYGKGQLAKNNAQIVARAARIGKELGCRIATPDEARKMLGIPSLKESHR